MIKNVLQIIYNNDGSLIDKELRSVRAYSNYTNVIQVIAPWDISVLITLDYTLYNHKKIKIQDYSKLAKDINGNYIKGKDVISPLKPYFQTVKDWNVWEVEVSQRALSAISGDRAGRFGISLTVKESSFTSEGVINGGTFGSIKSTTGGDLPETAQEGEYFRCDLVNYYSTVADDYFNYRESAIWLNDKWEKGTTYSLKFNLSTQDIPVDPSMDSVQIDEIEYNFTEQVLENIAEIYSEITNLEDGYYIAHIDNYKGYFDTVDDLIQTYPEEIENPLDRFGWYATVIDNMMFYVWDEKTNKWLSSGETDYVGQNIYNLHASNIKFDNTGLKFNSDNVRDALIEARSSNMIMSSTEPSNQFEGDFWLDISEVE